jgi:hypothetical protein
MSDLDRNLAELALTQHSVITLDDVERLGGNKHHASARVAAGRWIKVHPRVYRLAGAPWTWEGRVFAAVMALGGDAAASHQCAARLHGIGFANASPEVSVSRGNYQKLAGITVRTSRDMDRCDRVICNSIPTTDAARTVLDVARRLHGTNLRNFVEDGRRLELFTWHDLFVSLAKHARKGRRGVTNMREAIIAGAVNDGITDTESELVALSLLRQHGSGTSPLYQPNEFIKIVRETLRSAAQLNVLVGLSRQDLD